MALDQINNFRIDHDILGGTLLFLSLVDQTNFDREVLCSCFRLLKTRTQHFPIAQTPDNEENVCLGLTEGTWKQRNYQHKHTFNTA